MGFPNGTYFKTSPIHINKDGDIHIRWANNKAETLGDIPGVTVIPTNETTKMDILALFKKLGVDFYPNKTGDEIDDTPIRQFFVNLFQKYVPGYNLF